MESDQSTSPVAGGFFAQAWIQGRKIVTFGRTEQEARDELKAACDLDARLRARARETAKVASP
jgi:hypothetical protein